MRRALGIGLLGLLALVVVLLLGLGLLVGTQGGSQWLLRQVPAIQVEGFQGRLGGSWQAEQLTWQGETQVHIEQPVVELRPSCLLRLTLCLERLIAERVTVELPPAKATEEPSAGLSEPSLPLAVEVGQVVLGELRIDGETQLQSARLRGHWDENGLRIEQLHLLRDDLTLDLQGHLQPRGAWPLQATGELLLPSPDGAPWRVEIQLSGDLKEQLQVQAASHGYLVAQLEGRVSPLAEGVPAELQLSVDDFLFSSDLPPSLRLDQLELQAAGNRSDGYRIQGSGELAGEGEPVALTLNALLEETGLSLHELLLRADEGRSLGLQGRVDWRDELRAEVGLDWQDFPWQRLYPLEEELPVQLREAQAQLSYRNGRYQGQFDAQLQGPAGPFSLRSPVEGDLQALRLRQVRLEAGAGRIDGQLALGFTDGVSWEAELRLEDLDPAYWLAELPGTLGGPLNSSGSLSDDSLQLSADTDLSGRLRGQPTRLRVELQGDGSQWQASQLDLRVGDNRLQGQASIGERLDGKLDIDLARLGQLWPELSGSLTGSLSLSGSKQAPQGQLQLSGRQVALDGQRLASLTLSASLDERQNGRFDLRANDVRAGELALGQLHIEGSGDRQRQRFELGLQGEKLDLELALTGNWDGADWRGQLRRGSLHSGGQDWQLAQPAALDRLADGRVMLGEHCWRQAEASLCAYRRQRLFPEPQLALRLDDFPLAGLQPWLPQDLDWQGRLNALVDLDLGGAGPRGQIEVDADGGLLRLREGEEWLEFPYRTLRLDSSLNPQRVDSQLRFAGEGLGELQVEVSLDPKPASKPISGEFHLSGFRLGVLRPFLPQVERLEGRVNGHGQIDGELQAPRIDGRLALSDGHVSGGELPMSFEGLHMEVGIAGERAEFDGGWHSGESGQGRLDGHFSWAAGPELDVHIEGSQLPVVVEPYARLQVAPDLHLRLEGRRLALSGTVEVPNGEITIPELPERAVEVSEDAVLVGTQEPQAAPLNLALDVQLLVGEEHLRFEGFGLTGELYGRLHVGDQMRLSGELNLRDGRYRAYGQQLELRRARLLFAGALDQPFLDIEAVRKVGDVTAGLRLTGRANQPRSEIFSTPAMSQEQALSYLVLGRPLGGGGDQNVVGQAALALGLAGSAPIASGLASRLGIEDFQLEKEGSGLTTSVVASGRLSDRLSLRYGVGLFEPISVLALRYELSKRLYLEVASGLASSVDLFYQRDF